jgi:hypothetical protein
VSRRVKLPGASELFRPTGADAATLTAVEDPAPAAPTGGAAGAPSGTSAPTVGGSGRIRHDEKITVYVSRVELLALEQARLRLRGELGLAVDRGRLVRAAIALALADLDAAGEDGELIGRLTAS